MNLIKDIYCEWVEDLGLSPTDILMVLLEKKDQEIEYLRNRLSKYENN